jgi:hypothetical protein
MEALGDLALAMGAAATGGSTTTTGSAAVSDDELRDFLGLKATDTTPRADMLNLLKLEAPLAVQARTEPGLFPINKFSAVPELIKVARVAANETGGVGPDADARKRIMIVPRVRVLDIITETQSDNWVRVTGVRVKDIDGVEKVIPLAPPPNGSQSAVVVALGTIESTRLALNTFKDSLSSRAAQRMGRNLIAHLRSNLTIRIPVTSLTSLPSSAMTSLQASARICRKLQNRAGLFYLKAAIHTQFRAADTSPKSVIRPICDRSIPTMTRYPGEGRHLFDRVQPLSFFR